MLWKPDPIHGFHVERRRWGRRVSLDVSSLSRPHFFPINVEETSPESAFSTLNRASRLSKGFGEAGSGCKDAGLGRVLSAWFSCEVIRSFEGDAIKTKTKKEEETRKICWKEEERRKKLGFFFILDI